MLFTIDVEEITDTNFHILWKKKPELNYEKLIDNFIDLSKGCDAKAFVLGTFAKKYPHLVKKLHSNGIEIASHGYEHNLVYEVSFQNWVEDIWASKKILEDLVGCKVRGYRSPSWSMPFKKEYYEELAKADFSFSSSYFPLKTYMYGNSINKKSPFIVATKYGEIVEYPIVRDFIPFSGGFYLRVLPLWMLKAFFKKTKNPMLYIHPYELIDENLLVFFKNYAKLNLDFLLAFYSLGLPKNKIRGIMENLIE